MDESPSLESQNLPRCYHSDEISHLISDATNGIPFNMNKLNNIVKKTFKLFILTLPYTLVERLFGKSSFIGSFYWKLD